MICASAPKVIFCIKGIVMTCVSLAYCTTCLVMQGHAALITAATKGHAAVLEYLLHKNARVDLKSQDVSHTVKTPAYVCVSVLTLHDMCMHRPAKHCGLRKDF